MKLKNVNIVNFRSIKEATIDFSSQCRILVGINESGKSNILKALSMVGDNNPTQEDLREPLPTEKPITEAYVRFVFQLELSEIKTIYSQLNDRFLSVKHDSPIIKNGSKSFSVYNFCCYRNEGLYSVNILDSSKNFTYWSIGEDFKIIDGWKKISEACPADFTVKINGADVILKNYAMININDYKDIVVPSEYIENADAKYLNGLIGAEIKKVVKELLPKVIFWKYEEENLLPASVDMNAFGGNPDTCIPLKNMFTLAGINNIGEEIEKAKSISQNKLRNLLKRVANHSTNHFRNVWKEYKEISFALEPNANFIEPNIVEKNHWRMSQRSDGVKRFITFLLHISSNVKSNVLQNSIILVDEPDISLHPSGVTYLRDELIETSKKNYVVFSTHSIFMIDKDNIERHIIVKKEQEKTSIINADKSNFVDEEVLLNALNYSVFEILKKDNIIFEGWRDKRLFKVAIEKIPTEYNKDLMFLKSKIKSLGFCHAEGVKDVKNLTPMLELADRQCLIISDGDDPAKEKQKEFNEMHGHGLWKRYDEIDNSIVTAEDFIKKEAITAQITKIKKIYPTLTGDPNIEDSGRMDVIKKWIQSCGVESKEIKNILNTIKEDLFNNLKASEIDNKYFVFLVGLKDFFEEAFK